MNVVIVAIDGNSAPARRMLGAWLAKQAIPGNVVFTLDPKATIRARYDSAGTYSPPLTLFVVNGATAKSVQ